MEKRLKMSKRKASYVQFASASVAAGSETPPERPDRSQASGRLVPTSMVGPFNGPVVAASTEVDQDALTRVVRLLGDSVDDDRNKATSLRLNESLWEAADLAVKQGWVPSLTALVEQSVTAQLVGFASAAAEQVALDEHYDEHPGTRSELWDIALAAAEIDGLPVAEHPDLVRQAVDVLGDDADIDMILVWAAGALAGSTP